MKKIIMLVMGLMLVFALAACGAKAQKTAEPAAPANSQIVTLKASNFKYDQAEYKVKKGQPVTITLDNTQGNHGAAITEFGVNLNSSHKTMTFTPDKAGTFTIQCSVMCGAGHVDMKSTLVVE
jgi:cytochrome c oxidase subunit 2